MTAPDLFGYAALLVTLIGFSLRDELRLQKLNVVGCLLWLCHFGLLSQWTAAAMMVLAVVMVSGTVFQAPRLVNTGFFLNILIIPVLAALILFGNVPAPMILPVLAGFFINFAVTRCKGYSMSIFIGSGELLWLAATILMGSLPASLANSANLVVLLAKEGTRSKPVTPAAQKQT